MHTRPRNRWLDIQIILASLAVTFSLGLWNVFARGSRQVIGTVTPPTPDPTSTIIYAPNPTATATVNPLTTLHLPKVHLLLGGSMPVAPVVLAGSSSDSSPSNAQNNASKGGGIKPVPAQPPAPPPVTNTGSSKP